MKGEIMEDNKLCGEFSAKVWAEEFVRSVKIKPEIATDEGTMLGWFANAIMAGYDKANQEKAGSIEKVGVEEVKQYSATTDDQTHEDRTRELCRNVAEIRKNTDAILNNLKEKE